MAEEFETIGFWKSLKQHNELNIEEEIITEDEFHYYIKNDLKVCYKLKIDDRVIVVGDEKDGVYIGIIKEFTTITKSKNIVPIITSEEDGVDYLVMGQVLFYDEQMYDKLLSLSSTYSAWNYISPSWCQLDKDNSQVFRTTEESLVLRNYNDK